jgi:hypothetical protein
MRFEKNFADILKLASVVCSLAGTLAQSVE